jgi:PAS domain S-box-containing protein
MLAGLVLLEVLSLALFTALLVRQQTHEVNERTRLRLEHQATDLALQSKAALLDQRPAWLGLAAKMMGEAPGVSVAKITDPAGNVLYANTSAPEQLTLDPVEKAQIALAREDLPRVFQFGVDRWEGVQPIYTGSELRGFAWIETDRAWDHEQLLSILDSAAIFGIVWTVASALLVLLLAGSISRPLAVLHRGTKALMESPESESLFPLPVEVNNEIGELIEAFNRMFASIVEQRSGLNDTLSLLDSMLANAPIGLAFFDRRYRFVRVNQVFTAMTGVPTNRHLGRTIPELLPQPMAQELEKTVVRVFAEEQPVRNLELSGQNDLTGKAHRQWTWLASAYPVQTTPHQVRWVGVIVLDATDRKRSEEALRKSEKLAATGRLAASIAHEINNPLEAITNLLFLLRNYCDLKDPALNYVALAEHEARRITEITQQTLRFYRQSTLPTRTNLAELVDSVLSLYQAKLNNLNIAVDRDFDRSMDLFCFAGEIRQVLANLVGNAMDAMSSGGRLLIRAQPSRSWKNPLQSGIRFTVADTGSGMDAEVRAHIFEAFFTTKEETGTGLGLWLSEEIILKHGGMIHVRSRAENGEMPSESGEKPSGTVFQIFLPDDMKLVEPKKQEANAIAG